MSDVNKAELRRAAEAAPKGEWTFDCAVPERHFCAQVWDSEGKDVAALAATEAGSYAAQHIAAANPSAVLSLLDDYDALLAERDQLRAQVEEQLPRLIDENHQLRAELAAIRGQDPVATVENRYNADSLSSHIDIDLPAGTKLYALPPQQPDTVSVTGVNEFAVEILRGALEGGDFDGGNIQEMGVRHGLLFPEQRTESCGEHCECAGYGFPVECFRIARALLSTRQAEEGD